MECGGSVKMKKGGWIKNAIKNPGSFTKQAQSAGMSVSAFRNKVLANKGDYSSTTVKRANLAKTLSKMKKGEDGVEIGKEPNKISSLSPAAQEVVNAANRSSTLSLSGSAPENPIVTTPEPSSRLARGGTEKVAAYQRMLRAKGFNIDVDGAWGKDTQAAYEKYIKSKKQSSPTTKPWTWTEEEWVKSANTAPMTSNGLPSVNLPSSSGIKSSGVRRKTEIKRPLSNSTLPSVSLPTSGGIKKRFMMGGSIPGVNGSVIGSTVPMSKAGQSFPRRNAGTSKLAKYKKK